MIHDLSGYDPDKNIEVRNAKHLSSSSNFVCTVCDVTCFTEEYYQKHLNGRKHKGNVQRIHKGTNRERKTVPSKTVDKPKQVLKYFSISTWRKKQPSPSRHSETQTSTENYCHVCDLSIKEQRNMKRHLKSKRHHDNSMKNVQTTDEQPDSVKPAEDRSQEHGFAVACKSKKGWLQFL